MSTEHDVIVVGGGPAGASAAWALRREGVDCLVLDREVFPREKLCAGWITPEVLEDLEFAPADYPHRFLTFETLRIAVKGVRFPFRSPQHSIRRFEFDRWLLERAGAPVRQHTVRNIVSDGNGFRIDDQFRCRYLIGAGGTRCPVFRELFRDREPRDRALQVVTQELEFEAAAPDGDCHLWFFEHGLPGYSWFVPKENGYVNVGIGGVSEKLKGSRRDIRWHWRILVERLLREGYLDRDPGRPGGYSYFLREKTPGPRSAQRGNAFLVGDALGLATRDMCEGIGPAVASGLMAARAIAGIAPYEPDSIAAHTLGQPLARRALDWALNH